MLHWVAKHQVRFFKASLVAGTVSSLAAAVLSPRASTLISWTYLLVGWIAAIMASAVAVRWLVRQISGVAPTPRTSSELVAALDSLSMAERLQLLVSAGAGWLALYAVGWIFGVLAVVLISSARH